MQHPPEGCAGTKEDGAGSSSQALYTSRAMMELTDINYVEHDK
ncbi:MAG: hypothetical protein ABF791_00520 [Acetobacter sp.]